MTIAADPHFAPAQDAEELQAVVLAAAIRGDRACREQLPRLHRGFEEPYRSVASAVIGLAEDAGFVDEATLGAALQGKRLSRRDPGGRVVVLTAREAASLICATPAQPGQAAAYLPLLQRRLEAGRLAEFRERAADVVRRFGDDPGRLQREIEDLVGSRPDRGDGQPSELVKFLPYFRDLTQLQQGTEFRGLDSGFTHLNRIANGLDAGLWVLAAPPSLGKTTFLWQLCQQTARLNRVPAIFVSMEQSEGELRTKALARLSRINGRHIARGRLHACDPEELGRLQRAAEEYLQLARHLTIIPGDATTTIESIGAAAEAAMARGGAGRCLVAVDYLQILPPASADAGRLASIKDRVDLHVSALRQLARRLDSPVVAISSENRAGYKGRHLGVFKESGGIEYSADIAAIMTLDREGTISANGGFRVVDLNVVKNRNGELGRVRFKFYPERAEFIECEKLSLPDEEEVV